MIRGAVYRVDLGNAKRGHEQRGRRYGVLVSPTDSPLSVVTIVPTSTSARPALHRPLIDFGNGPTLALVDQLRVLDICYLSQMAGYLTRDEFAQVEHAISQYLGLVPSQH